MPVEPDVAMAGRKNMGEVQTHLALLISHIAWRNALFI